MCRLGIDIYVGSSPLDDAEPWNSLHGIEKAIPIYYLGKIIDLPASAFDLDVNAAGIHIYTLSYIHYIHLDHKDNRVTRQSKCVTSHS